jgi:anaerobic ribonucleoside-triphosphate reductase activating protein
MAGKERKDRMRIAKIEPCSINANGPGARIVIWFQGCMLRCPGCCNPEFQDMYGGTVWGNAFILADEILRLHREYPETVGVTYTGGEPLVQAYDLAIVNHVLKDKWPERTLVLFTGHRLDELTSEWRQAVWGGCDLVISGRYEKDKHIDGGLIASSNQKLYFPYGRWGMKDIAESLATNAELIVEKDGSITLTGMVPDLLKEKT